MYSALRNLCIRSPLSEVRKSPATLRTRCEKAQNGDLLSLFRLSFFHFWYKLNEQKQSLLSLHRQSHRVWKEIQLNAKLYVHYNIRPLSSWSWETTQGTEVWCFLLKKKKKIETRGGGLVLLLLLLLFTYRQRYRQRSCGGSSWCPRCPRPSPGTDCPAGGTACARWAAPVAARPPDGRPTGRCCSPSSIVMLKKD